MTTTPADVGRLRDHADFASAVPTPDHFIPLLYLAGLADAAGTPADVLIDGYAYGSLSMTSYTLGTGVAPPTEAPDDSSPAAPFPTGVPPEDTNL